MQNYRFEKIILNISSNNRKSKCWNQNINLFQFFLQKFVSFSINFLYSARFGLRDYGIDLSPTELEQVFLYFDASKDGFISVDEFLIGDYNLYITI